MTTEIKTVLAKDLQPGNVIFDRRQVVVCAVDAGESMTWIQHTGGTQYWASDTRVGVLVERANRFIPER